MSLTRAEAEKRINIMASFVEHPGWEIYEAQMKAVEKYWLQQVVVLTSAEERAIAVGIIRGMRQMYGWPVKHALACQEAEIREQKNPGDGGFQPEEGEKS